MQCGPAAGSHSRPGQIVKEIHSCCRKARNGGHAFMRNARKLENGNYLVAHYGLKVVREYDSTGKLVREIPADGGPHSVVRLSTATRHHFLRRGPGGSRVFEWTPPANRLAGCKGNELAGVQFEIHGRPGTVCANGDTLMANWLGPQTIWQHGGLDRSHGGQARRLEIYGAATKSTTFLGGWFWTGSPATRTRRSLGTENLASGFRPREIQPFFLYICSGVRIAARWS